jgi:hypothetical protein
MAEPDRDSQFLRWSLDLVDTGITAALPTYTLDVFKVIWRFTMRGAARDEGAKNHVLYADVSQNLIAALVGCSRQWVNTCVGVLEAMRWLKRLGSPKPGGQQRYALGTLTPVPKKPPVENYWALARSKALMKAVDALEAKETKSYWEDRPEKVREMLVAQGVSLPPLRRPAQRKAKKDARIEAEREASEGVDPVNTGDRVVATGDRGGRLRRQGWSPEATGGVACDDTLNREPLNREPSNREPSNISASAHASPPASGSASGDVSAEQPPPADLAGSAHDQSDDPDHDKGSAENLDPAEAKAAYREWLFSDADADEVVDGAGEPVVGDDENDQSPEGEETDVNDFEKSRKAMADAVAAKLAQRKETKAAVEAKRTKLGKHKQLAKNLSGPNLEKHIPKGSVKRMERVWLKAFDEHYPDFSPAKWWLQDGEHDDGSPKFKPGKESGLVSQLVQMYSPNDIEKYLKWAVANWGSIQTRFKNVPAVPAINFLYGFRESLVPEALMGNAAEQVEAELRAWYREHPNEEVPAELSARVQALKGRG